jgi:beta-glucanase (GH16 family)
VIDNVAVYPTTVRPPDGAPIVAGMMPPPPVYSAVAVPAADAATAKPGYRLTFQDEFDGTALDMSRWNYGRTPKDAVKAPKLIQDTYPCEVKDGVLNLRIEKRRRTCEIKPGDMTEYSAKALATYTAPGIATWNKFQQAYGWFEIRCRMPKAYGIWTGFWLLPLQRCEGAAEIDIFESLTRWNDQISFALHPHWPDGGKFGHAGIWVPGLADGFHVYALSWEPDKLTLYVDGVPVDEYTGKGVPSAAKYIIVSCRTGGWAGDFVDESALPDDFVIDYVRVYQRE